MTETNVEHLRELSMHEFSKTIELFDITPAEAHLYTYLYLKGKPLTLDDMSKALGKSKTSMSNGIRTLSQMNLVSRVWKKGERKNLYEANKQLLKIFMTTHTHKWLETIHHQKNALQDINNMIQQQKRNHQLPNNDLDIIHNHLQQMITFHEQLSSLFTEIHKNV